MASFHVTEISNACQVQKGGEAVRAPVAWTVFKLLKRDKMLSFQLAEVSFGTSRVSCGM